MNGPAIVTGAGRGLGAAVAGALVRRGWQVTLVARSAHEVEAVAAGLGEQALPIAADVSQPDDADRIVEAAIARFGPPRTLVNNAAIFGPIETLVESDPESWLKVLRVNVFGAYLLLRKLLPLLPEGSQVLAVSSGAAVDAGSHHSAYAPSKAALESLHRQVAVEHPRLRVAVLDPGGMTTAMMQALMDSDDLPQAPVLRQLKHRMRPADRAGEAVAALLEQGLESGRRYHIDELDPTFVPA